MKNNDGTTWGTQLNSKFDRLLFMIRIECTNTIGIME